MQEFLHKASPAHFPITLLSPISSFRLPWHMESQRSFLSTGYQTFIVQKSLPQPGGSLQALSDQVRRSFNQKYSGKSLNLLEAPPRRWSYSNSYFELRNRMQYLISSHWLGSFKVNLLIFHLVGAQSFALILARCLLLLVRYNEYTPHTSLLFLPSNIYPSIQKCFSSMPSTVLVGTVEASMNWTVITPPHRTSLMEGTFK